MARGPRCLGGRRHAEPARLIDVGAGDNLMATGMARGAKVRGKRIAFGNGKQILWDKHSPIVFQGNDNIAPPGSETADDLEWVPFYKGHRIYNTHERGRWIWNYDFRATPGEVFLSGSEKWLADTHGKGFIVVEPNVPEWKTVAPNKKWPRDRYEAVARILKGSGHDVVQFKYPQAKLIPGVRVIRTETFRAAVAALANAALYIGPEGGLHHAAAAVGVPAVVLFGGFIPPQVTGYDTHTNLTGGMKACGSLTKCKHCTEAMMLITVDEVHHAALGHLKTHG